MPIGGIKTRLLIEAMRRFLGGFRYKKLLFSFFIHISCLLVLALKNNA